MNNKKSFERKLQKTINNLKGLSAGEIGVLTKGKWRKSPRRPTLIKYYRFVLGQRLFKYKILKFGNGRNFCERGPFSFFFRFPSWNFSGYVPGWDLVYFTNLLTW